MLASDGKMSVIMHIDPSDSPVSYVPQKFIFYYDDPSENFDARQCLCSMNLSLNGKNVLNVLVPAGKSYYGQYPYTFKQAGVYDLQLLGQPETPGSFSSFLVNYHVRVAAGQPTSTYSSITTQILLTIALLIVATSAALVSMTFYNNLRQEAKK